MDENGVRTGGIASLIPGPLFGVGAFSAFREILNRLNLFLFKNFERA